MRRKTLLSSCCAVVFGWVAAQAADLKPFRPPATPLVACDPYFSVWSNGDKLTDSSTRHWTGRPQPLVSLIRVDGKPFRLMGDNPGAVPPLPQVGLKVLPTRTIYDFEDPSVHVTLTFLTPSLADDLDLFSRPVTYLTWDVRSVDGKPHDASVFFSASAALAVDSVDQKVGWSRPEVAGLDVLRVGSEDQAVLRRKGDDLRIDWGYAYVAAAKGEAQAAVGSDRTMTEAFVADGKFAMKDDPRQPRAASDENPALAFAFDLGKVSDTPVSRRLMMAYDDEFSITYFRKNLRPYWRRSGADAAKLLTMSAAEYDPILARCRAFDAELMADLTKAGGAKYAQLAALAYRQAMAAHKLVADSAGQPLLFSKENFSNGCIATVDVTYPGDPIFLLLSPTLAKATIASVLAYSASDRWRFPFAPHDLGTYPMANGQVYGGGERTEENQMPVEETGNVLLLLGAIARVEGNADFASKFWPQLQKWAKYLEEKGFDPENQLCTDDFAGHLAHNVNLSAKAILAIAAYGLLCEYRGEKAEAARYHAMAVDLAKRWVAEGTEGDHTRLAFDQPNTWSQKYNLVWDKLLKLNVFPASVIETEVAFYLKHQDKYGVPLDNRKPYAKLDWTVWSATLATKPADFEALVSPLYDFLDDSTDRVPMSDWYYTRDAEKAGFQARSVVGGVFIKMLDDMTTWKKWASRDKASVSNWAPIPPPPVVKVVVPTARERPNAWMMTTEKPSNGLEWTMPSYADTEWTKANGGFGSSGTPGTGGSLRTEWKSSDIWLRRSFSMPTGQYPDLQLNCYHDEDVEIYLNGVLAAKIPGYNTDYETLPILPAAKASLKPGAINTIAVHCHQTGGGQYIDVGFATIEEGGK